MFGRELKATDCLFLEATKSDFFLDGSKKNRKQTGFEIRKLNHTRNAVRWQERRRSCTTSLLVNKQAKKSAQKIGISQTAE